MNNEKLYKIPESIISVYPGLVKFEISEKNAAPDMYEALKLINERIEQGKNILPGSSIHYKMITSLAKANPTKQ